MEEPMDHSSLPPSAKRTPQKTCTDFSTRDEMGDSLSSASTEIARGHPKRKPDKSTICRVRSNSNGGCFSCSNCSKNFQNELSFEEHASSCIGNVSPSAMDTYSDEGTMDDQMENITEKILHPRESPTNRHDEDIVNNNQRKFNFSPNQALMNDEDKPEDNDSNHESEKYEENPYENNTSELSLNEQLANSSMALEAINNTRITLARLASAAAAQESPNEKSSQDLSLLQRALYNLQHQQVIQMQLIKQLQDQLSIKNRAEGRESQSPIVPSPVSHKSERSENSPILPNESAAEQPITSSIINNLMDHFKAPKESTKEVTKSDIPSTDPRDRPLSPTTPSANMVSSVIQHNDTPPASEPNTLEMLKRTANQVLSNASQGLLTNRLIDDYSKNPDGSDTSTKHRCRYCGKVFGSDSALQIHLRSHTGERPFKCNICGNRFTTKGNLKVHFQRHQARFPHIKMNPHPIPEHLDKLYPPLLAQLGELSDCPPAPTGPPSPFPSVPTLPGLPSRVTDPSPPPSVPPPIPPPFDFQLGLSNPLLSPMQMAQEKPENLSWHRERLSTPPFAKEPMRMDTSIDDLIHSENGSRRGAKSPLNGEKIKEEPDLIENTRIENSQEDTRSSNEDENFHKSDSRDVKTRSQSPSNVNNRDILNLSNDSRETPPKKEKMDTDPVNHDLSNQSNQADIRPKVSDMTSPPNIPHFPFPGMRLPFPLNFPFLSGINPPFFPNSLPPPQPRPMSLPPGVDPSKDPNVYHNLLPRPGSTDNSWEALIEVKKTSETMKLEELVKKIEYKLEPNQCVICHRVLSCKSALQMHYRTHTGERPFKCKICNHTFTTKGNLKTHMSVHRARPHIGMLHQCPVCHKKFGNALVLQQHIRLHTGESTDLSPEQIAAAEIRDMGGNFPPFPQNLFPPGIPIPPHHPLRCFPPFPLPMRYPISPDMLRNQEKQDEDKKSEDGDSFLRLKNEMQSPEREQKVAEDLSTRMRDEALNNSSPRRSVSPSPSDYSDPGMRDHNSNDHSNFHDPVQNNSVSPAVSTGSQDSPSPLNLISRPPHPSFWSPFGLFPQPLTSASMNPVVPSSMSPVFSPLYMPNMPGRGNTTCKICFKTLACQSALEIHYRSHTKERPYKCTHCDRGFTTKGNMKQHLLTHKIRTSSESKLPDSADEGATKVSSSPDSQPSSSFPVTPSPSSIFTTASSTLSPTSFSGTQQSNDVSVPLKPSTMPFFFPNSSADSTANSIFSSEMAGHFPNLMTSMISNHPVKEGKEPKLDLINLKRERDREFPLPMSKRSQSTEESRPLDLHQEKSSSFDGANGSLHGPDLPSRLTTPPSTLPLQVS